MKKCPKCGATIDDNDAYCTYCGAKFDESFKTDSGMVKCEYCGSMTSEADKYCAHCGMERKSTTEYVNTNSYSSSNNTNYYSNYSNQTYEKKSFLRILKDFFKNIFNFKGRSTRREYFISVIIVTLIFSIVGSVLQLICPIYYTPIIMGMEFEPILVIEESFIAVSSLLTLSITIRRIRDAGKSPYYYFWIFIPLIGDLVIFLCLLKPTNYYHDF